MENSYFQILMQGDKTFLRIFPATDGGKDLTVGEIKEYLTLNMIEPENTSYLNEIAAATEKKDILLCNKVGLPINESYKLIISNDRMLAVLRFYPPSTGGKLLTQQDVESDLKAKGIKVEIESNMLASFFAKKQYCFNYIVAKGVAPIEGKNASIEYFFNTNPNTKPKLNEDGSVDFFNLQTISKCVKGQVLATLTPEVLGVRGVRVTGEPVLPRDVRKAELRKDKNVSFSEDGLSLIADVDGHVSLYDGKVSVSDVYEIIDVDTSTGNIDYAGNVLIKGNVKTGFSVRSDGNVEVKGVVEGAEIHASGSVIIARGFNGMERGYIEAGGSVVAKFIENGKIDAVGNIMSEAVIHSRISSKGNIEVTGKKGCIVGGTTKALGNVTAKTVGSEMGGDTSIEVGVDPKLKLLAADLEAKVKKSKENMDKAVPIIANFTKKIKEKAMLTPDQIRYFKQVTQEYKEEKEKCESLNREYDEVVAKIDNMPTDSSIIVTGKTYPGAFFTINEVSKRMESEYSHSRFVRDGADIRIAPI